MTTKQKQNNIDILKRFDKQANKLADEKYNNLQKFKVSLSFSAETSVGSVKSSLPDTMVLKSFLMDFRLFYITKENNFNLKNICQKFVKENYQADKAKEWLVAYESILNTDAVMIRIGGTQLTQKMIFETILNADNFHQEGSQKGMDLIKSHPLSEPLVRAQFFSALVNFRIVICSFNTQIVKPYLEIYDN